MLRSRIPAIARTLEQQLDSPTRKAAERIADEARSRVPVDTGALRSAIHVDKREDGAYAVVAGDGDVFYGHIVEHGGVNTPARPFLIPAFESVRDNIDELVRDALRDL